ncbi:ABC transporter ATP-binding protein [bacterium]|nr:ABC transporter ATP-binding protein [bacterium]
MPESALAVRVAQLKKSYGKTVAVAGIDLSMPAGECFGLLGPNGAGKTTTVEILEGILRADSGSVEVLGMRFPEDAGAIRERIGVALQDTELYGRLTALETVELFASFYERPRDPIEVLEDVGLEEKKDDWVERLSGGQRQRLALGLALVHDPALVFLDEPTTGLDPRARRETWALLEGLKKKGVSLLLTTHFMDEAEALCDRVAIVDRGRVIALGTPLELVRGLGGDAIVEVETDPAPDTKALAALDGVRKADATGSLARLVVERAHEVVPRLLALLESSQRKLRFLSTRHGTLEDVFLALTGRRLDEATGAPANGAAKEGSQ